MHIGIVVAELDRHSGGLGQWCWQYIGALAKQVSAIHVVTQRVGDGVLPANVFQHRLPPTKSRTTFAAAAEAFVQQLQVDVVHDMGAGRHFDICQPHGGSHLAWLARRADMYPWWQRTLKRVDRFLPRQRDYLRHCGEQFASDGAKDKTFVALSQTVADDFAFYHGIRPERIAVVYNGVDCTRFSPEHRHAFRDDVRERLGIREDAMLLLLAAHHFRLKGVPELIDAAARVADDGRRVHVVVAGGKRLGKWRRMADRAGLVGRTTFLGAVRDMVPYYAAADAYVHPTYYDPCSLVLLEAAASGLPIITTRRCNGAAELFRSEREILTVDDPRDSRGLHECVDALFDDRFRRQLGIAARQVALRHTFDRNVAEFATLYEGTSGRRIAA